MTRFFDLLTDGEKQKTLNRVNKFFDKTFYHKTLFKHSIFEKQFPFEFKHTPIGELREDSKKLHDFLFEQSQAWIPKIYDKLTENQALKQITRRRKSINHSTFRKFCKIEKRLKEGGTK